MLKGLYVSNLALIRRLSVDFESGFSVLTGETGAGKSLVLDSLGLFLSSKGGKDLIRHGEEKLEVSLFFHPISDAAKEALSEWLSPEEAEEGITLSREWNRSGKSTGKLNGRSLPFGKISQAAKVLFSIHGQSAASGLLEEKNHRLYLDSALPAKGLAALSDYRRLYSAFMQIKRELQEMEQDAGNEKEKLALYDYSMQEIARVKPKIGEEEELEAQLRHLQSFEKIHAALSTAHRALSGGEKGKGALYLLSGAARKLEQTEQEAYVSLSGELYEIARRAEEIEKDLAARLWELGEEDPTARIDRIHKRLDALYQLKRKYGSTVEEILSYYEELKRKKDLTLSRKDDIKKAKEKLLQIEKEMLAAGKTLSEERKKVAETLREEIHSVLSFLDMPNMRFFVDLTPLTAPAAEGMEKVSFSISANTGEGTMPLGQVASGGELSRIMLALQLKLGKAKDADTLIFDEVDTGISGATAQKIGLCLKTLAQRKQIFCVTHSAQVSSLCDHHFLVEKREEDGRTETHLTHLDAAGSQKEVARLLGGKQISTEAQSAAESLRLEGLAEWERTKDTFS